MRIAIIVNEKTADRCTGAGCLKAFYRRKDAFVDHDENTELVGFFHVGGDLEKKINSLIKNEVDTIHLSSCLRSSYDKYEELANQLSKHFNIIGYTHGNRVGKKKEAIFLLQH